MLAHVEFITWINSDEEKTAISMLFLRPVSFLCFHGEKISSKKNQKLRMDENPDDNQINGKVS